MCVCVFHLCALGWGVALVGEFIYWHCSPRRGKIFQVLEVHQRMKHIQELSCEKGQNLALLCFVKFRAENPVFVYVNEKFCNKNLF